MDVDEAVRQRISCRAFLPDPICEDEIRSWLEVAQRAPSGGNLQPWRVIAVTGTERDAVVQLAAGTLANSPRGQATDRPIYPPGLWDPYEQRRRAVGEQLYETLGIPREDRAARRAWFANNFNFFGAPVGLFFIIDERMGHGQWAHTGMFMQTLALLAEARGWGTCMQECWAMLRPALKLHFGLAESDMVYCGMAVGWPDREAAVNRLRTVRAGLDEFADLRGF